MTDMIEYAADWARRNPGFIRRGAEILKRKKEDKKELASTTKRVYTEEKLKFIQDNYGRMTTREIAANIGTTPQRLSVQIAYMKHKGMLPGKGLGGNGHQPSAEITEGTRFKPVGDDRTASSMKTVVTAEDRLPAKNKHHSSVFQGDPCLTTERSAVTKATFRHLLSAEWLEFTRLATDSNGTMMQVKAGFVDHLFGRYGI